MRDRTLGELIIKMAKETDSVLYMAKDFDLMITMKIWIQKLMLISNIKYTQVKNVLTIEEPYCEIELCEYEDYLQFIGNNYHLYILDQVPVNEYTAINRYLQESKRTGKMIKAEQTSQYWDLLIKKIGTENWTVYACDRITPEFIEPEVIRN